MKHWSNGLTAAFNPFAPHLNVATQFQTLFTLLSQYFSVFARATQFAIGLRLYLGLEVNPPVFTPPIQETLLRIPPLALN